MVVLFGNMFIYALHYTMHRLLYSNSKLIFWLIVGVRHRVAPREGKVMSSATIMMAGVGSIDIETEDGSTVRDVLEAAAEQLGFDPGVKVTVILGGEAVDLDAELAKLTTEDNPSMVAAPQVANG